MPPNDLRFPAWLDGSLYPECEPPTQLDDLADQVDFLARLCAAWDFGILPEPATIAEIRRPAWRDAVEQCQLLTSPTYHLLRAWHGLPPCPYLGQELGYIRDDPNLAYV
jgi:hypothetical protein